MIPALRLIADYLWQYKELSVGLSGLAAVQLVYLLSKRTMPRAALLLSLLLAATLSVSLLFTPINETTLTNLFKLASLPVIFLCGALGNIRQSASVPAAVVGGLLMLPILASLVTGSGYQTWGAATTFTGGFFFKFDLALFLTLLGVYLAAALRRWPWQWLLFPALGLYALIVVSNSRLFYLVFPLVVLACGYRVYRRFRPVVFAGVSLTAVTICAAVLVLFLMVIPMEGLLLVDLNSDLFGEKNTQGRSKLWTQIGENFFYETDFLHQLLGSGIGADGRYIGQALGRNHADLRDSHNAYLYVLVNHGYLGIGVCLLFCAVVFRRFLYVSHAAQTWEEDETLCLAFGSMLIMLCGSVTNNTLVYAQASWPCLYFCGRLFLAPPVREFPRDVVAGADEIAADAEFPSDNPDSGVDSGEYALVSGPA